MSERKRIKITIKNANQRLDLLLSKSLPEYSRQFIREQIKLSHITIDGKEVIKPKIVVRVGQLVEYRLDDPQNRLIAQPIKLDIIYQDGDLVVVNKPAGMVMHPAGKHKQWTLANALKYKFKEFYLVHRLDKDTSGLVLVARNEKIKKFLSKLFEQRKIKKTYTTLLTGKVKPIEAYIDLPISRSTGKGKFETIAGGRQAKSYYKVKEYIKNFSLVEVQPQSGRTHQIRVHFKALGHPVVGDKLYNNTDDGLRRQFLHAGKLEFIDWVGNKREFMSSLPQDLSNFLKNVKE